MLQTNQKPTKEFLRHIEEAIQEFGVIACPNPDCDKKIVSKKKLTPSGNSFIRYQCINPDCSYHKVRKIKLEKIITFHKSDNLSSSKSDISKIFIVLSICLFSILSYMSYQLYSINQYIENEIDKTEQPNTLPDRNLTSNRNSTAPSQ